MRAQRRLDLAELDAEPADLHLQVGAAEELQPVAAAPDQVAGGVQPRAGPAGERVGPEPLGGQPRQVVVPAGHARAADVQLADHPVGHRRQGRVQHVQGRAGDRRAEPDRTGGTPRRRRSTRSSPSGRSRRSAGRRRRAARRRGRGVSASPPLIRSRTAGGTPPAATSDRHTDGVACTTVAPTRASRSRSRCPSATSAAGTTITRRAAQQRREQLHDRHVERRAADRGDPVGGGQVEQRRPDGTAGSPTLPWVTATPLGRPVEPDV